MRGPKPAWPDPDPFRRLVFGSDSPGHPPGTLSARLTAHRQTGDPPREPSPVSGKETLDNRATADNACGSEDSDPWNLSGIGQC
jgi:hypothetical protein